MSRTLGPAGVPTRALDPMVAAGRPGRGSARRLDVAIGATVAALLATLVIGLGVPVEVRVVAPGLDLAIDTVATLVTLAVAVLAWQRYRDRGQRTALFEASAFLVLAAASAIAAIQALAALDTGIAAGLAPFSEGALYVATAARLIAATLLVVGEAPALRASGTRMPRLVAIGPAAVVVGLVLVAPAVAGALPPLLGATATGPGQPVPALPPPTAANVVLQAIGAALFAAAAASARRRAVRGGPVSEGFLAVGLVFAAFAQLHLAFYPSAYAGIMTSGDLLYLAFDVILLLGIEAETRAYTVELRHANLGLERLREAEVGRAAIEERARLSRELHDGLAQDLWFAKLKVGRLAALPDLDPEARSLCSELDEAIDAGLTEARQAVMALRAEDHAADSFSELMARYVDDYGDRFGIRTEFVCARDVPRLDTRVEAELLRIAQEALSNILRHADATVVRVEVARAHGLVVLTVRDNGRGFDPSAVDGRGFGLTSMSERAALIGGRFTIDSRPLDGARVTIEIPAPPEAPGGSARGSAAGTTPTRGVAR